jgi:hypothetical protein
MRTLFPLALLAALLPAPALAKDLFLAPTGNDANPGTLDAPFATVTRAQQAAAPGDTVYFRGGTYKFTEAHIATRTGIFARVFDLNKSGTKDAPIRYVAYKNEKPTLDFSAIKPANFRVIAFYVGADYLHFKGLDLTGVQVTITGHTQSEFFENHGSNNTYEQLQMHDSQAIGFYLLNGSNNLVLNCDAWNNYDFTSEGGRGGNVDGFGAHPRKGAVNNVFRGCRAWFNSDDGYDCINSAEAVTFDNCWAMYNGLAPDGKSLGDGNGFKAGGYGSTPAARLPNPIPRHVVRFCLAVGNKSSGHYSNHHTGGVDFFNNTAFRNGVNFNFLERLPDNTKDIPGTGHKAANNLGYKGNREVANLAPEGNDLTNNSFSITPPLTLTDADFVSLDEKQLLAPRKPDGSLPDITFMKPTSRTPALATMGIYAK